MKRSLALLAALAFAGPLAAATYTLDPDHTQVVFSWNHFGFSHPSAQFGTVEGTLVFDPADLDAARVEVRIPLASINTNVKDLDAHVVKDDFFDVEKYPDATFRSTRVEAVPGNKDRFRVTGDLTIRDQTRPLTLDATLNRIGEHPMRKTGAIGFDATGSLKRSDFGIRQFVPMVGDEINLRITVEAFEPAPEATGEEASAEG